PCSGRGLVIDSSCIVPLISLKLLAAEVGMLPGAGASSSSGSSGRQLYVRLHNKLPQ
ncbi:hypothetical protein JOQ06_020939, partial [Pogonophryne albipinna]